MAESLRAKVEEQLSCAICLEHFKDPKVLSCQHTYCLECIARLDMTGNFLICPVCRAITEVPYPPDVSFLPSNFFANNLLATLAMTNNSAANPTQLNGCSAPSQPHNRSNTTSPHLGCNQSNNPSSSQSHNQSRTPIPPQRRNRSLTPSSPQRRNQSHTPSSSQSHDRSRTPIPPHRRNRSRTLSPPQRRSRSRTPSPPHRRNRSRSSSPPRRHNRSRPPSIPQRRNRSRTPSPPQRRNRSHPPSSSQTSSGTSTSTSSQSSSESSTSTSSQSSSGSSPPRSRFPRGSFVGHRIFRYGIHYWSVEINHSQCPGDDSCLFEIGVISHDNANTVTFEGFIMPGCCEEFSLDLDMPDDALTVDASWLGEPADFDVYLQRLSPYLKLDCETCLIEVTDSNFYWHFDQQR